MIIGFHCSHEQYSPAQLLALVQKAEKSGFKAAMSSDHTAPWSVRQGQSGFAWSWLGAAMQATSILFGSMAIPGGWRYHPVIVAQAAATLAEMFPERFSWIAAGSGEAMNEHMTGTGWPEKKERNARLKAGVDMIRALWRGETVTSEHGPIPAHSAKIWSLPEVFPKIYGAALSTETAEWLGGWVDGMITTGQAIPDLQRMILAFEKGGGKNKPVIVQAQLSWDETDEQARYNAWDQWRCSALGRKACAEHRSPEEFDRASLQVTLEDMNRTMLISADVQKHIENIKAYQSLGIAEIYLHNAGRNQQAFIEKFSKEFLPAFH